MLVFPAARPLLRIRSIRTCAIQRRRVQILASFRLGGCDGRQASNSRRVRFRFLASRWPLGRTPLMLSGIPRFNAARRYGPILALLGGLFGVLGFVLLTQSSGLLLDPWFGALPVP